MHGKSITNFCITVQILPAQGEDNRQNEDMNTWGRRQSRHQLSDCAVCPFVMQVQVITEKRSTQDSLFNLYHIHERAHN